MPHHRALNAAAKAFVFENVQNFVIAASRLNNLTQQLNNCFLVSPGRDSEIQRAAISSPACNCIKCT